MFRKGWGQMNFIFADFLLVYLALFKCVKSCLTPEKPHFDVKAVKGRVSKRQNAGLFFIPETARNYSLWHFKP